MTAVHREDAGLRLLASLAVRLCGTGAAAAEPVGAPATPTHAAETAALGRCSPARQAEFAAGRQAARAALRRLGMADPGPILSGPGRQPVWPAGIAGSITHAAGIELAIVARKADCAALGIDLEPAEPLPEDILDAIITDDERAGLPAGDPLAARIVFCAKEALFKAQFPLGGTWLGFHDARVALCPDDARSGRFEATLCRTAGPLPSGSALAGRYALAGGVVIAGLALPPAPGAAG